MGRSRFWGLVLSAHGAGLGAPTWSEGSSLQHLSQMALWSWALFSSFQLPCWNIPPKTVNSLLHQEHKAMNGPQGFLLGSAGRDSVWVRFWGPAVPRACSVLLPERPWCQAGERAVPVCLLPCHR